MNAHDLARWTRFAGKGGIGKCTAVVDCVAQEMGEDLMFLKVSLLPMCGPSSLAWSNSGREGVANCRFGIGSCVHVV